MKLIDEAALPGKIVLLQISADVPLSGGMEKLVSDDRRLRASLPTLHFLLNRGATVVLLGHLGRPSGRPVAELSLRPVYLQLSALLKKPIIFAPTLFSPATSQAITTAPPGTLIGLENLRFDPGQSANSRTFAQKLASYGQLYVNDDFPDAHRSEASSVALAELLPSYAGLALEKEYQVLTSLLRHPARPLVVILGGAKVADKLPTTQQLLHQADRILLGGAIASTFLAAEGVDVKNSVVDKELLPQAEALLKQGRGKLLLPSDNVWSPEQEIRDIGPVTTQQFAKVIGSAQTIFWNGNLGKTEEVAYRHGSDTIARAIADSGATSIVGGGNTTEIFDRLKIANRVSFVSSGGGATLALLAGQKLPAIEALN